MRIISIGQGSLSRPAKNSEANYIYNGLDALITHEVAGVLGSQIKKYSMQTIYKFVLEQRPALLSTMRRGIKIDVVARDKLTAMHKKEIIKFQEILDRFAIAVSGNVLNANSHQQCKRFFYESMNLPEQKKWDAKTRSMKITADRDALEKLMVHFYAEPLIRLVLKIREIRKRLGWLASKLTSDGRFTFTITPGATETGRTSSSKSAYGLGNNVQNIENEHDPARASLALRRQFIPDPGMKMGNADLAQAESNIVSRLSRDKNYMRAHDLGDPHTMVAGMVWPELAFTGNLAADKKLAGAHYYRTFSYRDMAKRGQHLSNYIGKPKMMADALKIPISLAVKFQTEYFREFSGIPQWHDAIKDELQTTGMLVTPLGRKRFFTGNLDDSQVIKEAVAYKPQSLCSDILKLGMQRIYNEIRTGNLPIQLLQEGHDSLLYQFPEGYDKEISLRVIELMTIPFNCNGVECCIGVDASVGYNWHELVDWKKGAEQKRPKEVDFLDRLVSSV